MTCEHEKYTWYAHTFHDCVNPANCNPHSHWGVTDILTCSRCEAVKLRNVNDTDVETLDWHHPQTSAA